jgi:hypothetical protein
MMICLPDIAVYAVLDGSLYLLTDHNEPCLPFWARLAYVPGTVFVADLRSPICAVNIKPFGDVYAIRIHSDKPYKAS